MGVKVNIVSRAVGIGRLAAYLAAEGFEVEEIGNPAQVADLVEELGKPYITPMSSPTLNDFTRSGIIGLLARRDGQPAMFGFARLEDLGDEPVGSYWRRVFGRAYGCGPTAEIICDVRGEVERSLCRRLVYFGDLFVAPHARGSRMALRAFVCLGHLAVSLKWDPDWTYCFVREQDVLRGSAALYGFNRVFGTPFSWCQEPPPPRSRSELLVAISRNDLAAISDMTIKAVSES